MGKKQKKNGLSVTALVTLIVAAVGLVLVLTAFIEFKRVQSVKAMVAVPAFPGAQGYGAKSVGGRGGRILFVTNLNSSGEGSLRQAIEDIGPRIVIFRVGGTIHLKEDMLIRNPYITIAGQTAPGDGIAVRGAGIRVGTHDVIIRNMRYRIGDAQDGPLSTSRDGINISNSATGQDVYNVMIDHSSVSWGVDENVSTWTNKVYDVTYQWSISSEALDCSIHIDEGATTPNCQGMGALFGDDAQRISIHHNLFANNPNRNPRVVGRSGQVINNVVYNWKNEGTIVGVNNNGQDQVYDIVGNFYKPGRDTRTVAPANRGIRISSGVRDTSKMYVKGNIGPNRGADSDPEWNAVYEENVRSSYKMITPQLAGGITTTSARQAYDEVLAGAGAIIPRRDPVDTRAVNDTKNGTGQKIDSQNQVGGWPYMNGGAAPADTDNDGIPDQWEKGRGLNPGNASDGNAIAPSGYTWVEEYINSFFTTSPLPTSVPNPSPTPLPVVSPTPSGDAIQSLTVKDAANNADWSERINFTQGSVAYGDRTYRVEYTPGVLKGLQWIRTAADSKNFTSTPVATFKTGVDATVFIAHDDRITTKPSWMSGYVKTAYGKMILNQNIPNTTTRVTYTLYSRRFPKDSVVTLGANGHTSHLMYMVFVKP